MRASHLCVPIFLTLAACAGSDKGTAPDDTGGIGDDGGDGSPESCDAEILEISPFDGEANVYYRSDLTVAFTDVGTSATFALTDGEGAEIAATATFDEAGLNAVITADEGMTGDMAHSFTVSVCDVEESVSFTTSVYGGALQIEAADLASRVFNFSLGEAEYVQPAGIGPILGNYLDAPLLIEVVNASTEELEIMGAQGWKDDVTGEVSQDTSLTTWDLGTASFAASPTFQTDPAQITIDYVGSAIILHDFVMQGTFEPDGASVGHGYALALADTRDMGPLFNVGTDEDAVCTFMADFGLECEECPDGNPWCLTMEALFEPALLVDGLSLVEVSG